jgi:hypothetical protein
MMRGLVVGPTQSSATAVRPVHTNNDLLDLGHAVTLSPTGFSDLCAVPQILAKIPLPIVSGVVPGEAGFAPLATPKRSSSTKGLRVGQTR